jgi:predicted aspartyl protease
MKVQALLLALTSAATIGSGVQAANSNKFTAGVSAYNRGDYKDASVLFQKVVAESPGNVNALYYDAICNSRLKNWPAAIALYKKILQISPDSAAGGDARIALNEIDASSRTAAGSAATPVASVQIVPSITPTTSSSNDSSSDGLPNTAHFYFTKEPGGHMSVDLMVNDHPMKAWFDTGASAFFYKDQLQESGVDTDNAVPGGKATGWNGVGIPVMKMPAKVSLGTFTRTIDIYMQNETSGLGHNLIGQDLIRGYQYNIDDIGGRVDLTRNGATTAQKFDPLYDIPLVNIRGRDTVQLDVNGTKVPAFLDTGAVFSMLDPKLAPNLGLDYTGGSERLGGVGGTFQAQLATANIRLGPMNKQNFLFRVGGTAGTCLGQDFMQNWRCEIDRENHLLRFFH